jgi:Uma2 family endonuclease
MNAYPQKKPGRFTWSQYRTWPDDERWELIEGEAYAMTPSPLSRHQLILGELYASLHAFLKGKPCKALPAPMDVKLTDEDVVQPDILVVCDPKQIRRTHVEGAPTLVVEILSPATALHDRKRKLALYAREGVREVWLVTPYPHAVEVFRLRDAAYVLAATYERTDTLISPAFPELQLDLDPVFDFPLEPGEQINLVKEGRPAFTV